VINPLLALWVAFLVGWKAWPSKPRPDENPVLAVMLYAGLAIILYNLPRSPRVTTLALVAVAFAFAIWSRAELGNGFSGEGPRVTTGPYAIVRHPIYWAIAAAVVLTALESSTLASYGAAGLALTALGAKGSQEDHGLATRVPEA